MESFLFPAVKQKKGYVDALSICTLSEFNQYLTVENVNTFINELSKEEKTPVSQLISFDSVLHVWIHPAIAIHLRCCLDPLYFKQVVLLITHVEQSHWKSNPTPKEEKQCQIL